jgi:succinate dehydrogenase / fumarate reductase iron-sulfur subunit
VPAPQDASPAGEPGRPDPGLTGETITLNVFRGTPGDEQGDVSSQVPVVTGMVVLDAIHYIQHNLDTDLAVRWNYKATKCGSCSAEINGRPLLMCKTRIDVLPEGPITVRPMKAFPLIKDLVTDVSRNYRSTSRSGRSPQPPDDGTPWRIQ